MLQNKKNASRRIFLSTAVAVAAFATSGTALGQAKDVEIGLIAPMSGPWARQGEVMKIAADLAISEINAQ